MESASRRWRSLWCSSESQLVGAQVSGRGQKLTTLQMELRTAKPAQTRVTTVQWLSAKFDQSLEQAALQLEDEQEVAMLLELDSETGKPEFTWRHLRRDRACDIARCPRSLFGPRPRTWCSFPGRLFHQASPFPNGGRSVWWSLVQ